MVIELQKLNARPCYSKAANIGIAAASLIAAGVAAATQTAGAIANSESAKKAEGDTSRSLDDRISKAKAKMNLAQDSIVASQNMVRKNQEQFLRNTEAARGSSVVSGGTNAERQAASESITNAYADQLSSAQETAEQRKYDVEDKGMDAISSLEGEKAKMKADAALAKQQAVTQGAVGVANAAGQYIASNYDHGGTSNATSNGGGATRAASSSNSNVPSPLNTGAKLSGVNMKFKADQADRLIKNQSIWLRQKPWEKKL